MQICVLDGEKIINRQTLHDRLSSSLELPQWYGRNLDALYDCLTEIQEETEIQLLNEPSLEKNLGSYFNSLLRVLHTASEENPNIQYSRE